MCGFRRPVARTTSRLDLDKWPNRMSPLSPTADFRVSGCSDNMNRELTEGVERTLKSARLTKSTISHASEGCACRVKHIIGIPQKPALAHPYVCRATSCPARRRPWCDGR